MENETVQVLKLVLIFFRACIIHCHLTAHEFKRSYSQQKFAEESDISWNPMKSFPSIFASSLLYAPISKFRLNGFLHNRGLIKKLSASRLLITRFLHAGFYCICPTGMCHFLGYLGTE